MAAAITFFGGQGGGTFQNLNSSGVGFFGSSFGTSVQVGQYQDTTYITGNTTGTIVQGPQLTNCKYDTTDGSGVIVNGDIAYPPSSIVVNSGTLNIRFTFDSAVQTQNGELRIFDRTDITNGAEGVTTQVLQVVNGGSGVSSSGTVVAPASHSGWIAPSGSGVTMVLLSSPGSGGLSPSGTSTTDTRHDWYVCMSATPLSIGSKSNFALYVQLEYF